MRTTLTTTLPNSREKAAIEIEEEPMVDDFESFQTPVDEQRSRFSSSGLANQYVSVVDIEPVADEDIEEDIDDEGLLSPNTDNALDWQQVSRGQKPQSHCTRSVNRAVESDQLIPGGSRGRGGPLPLKKNLSNNNVTEAIEEDVHERVLSMLLSSDITESLFQRDESDVSRMPTRLTHKSKPFSVNDRETIVDEVEESKGEDVHMQHDRDQNNISPEHLTKSPDRKNASPEKRVASAAMNVSNY